MGVALMGLPGEVPTAAYVPVLMFAILSGLSMDYEVFLLSRERAQWLRTGGNAGSVVAGLSSTARVISSAALMGIGLETAIAVDATLLRLVLVPATMAPLGNRNWYLPAWLDRVLPHLDTRGTWSKAGSADAEGQRGVRQNPAVVDNHRKLVPAVEASSPACRRVAPAPLPAGTPPVDNPVAFGDPAGRVGDAAPTAGGRRLG